MATVTGGGVTTFINVGSNDANGVAQQLANIISQGLASGTYVRTNGPSPATGGGVLTVSTQNSNQNNLPNVLVDLVNGGGASVATDTVTIGASGGVNQALIADSENMVFYTNIGTGQIVTGDGNNLLGTPISSSPTVNSATSYSFTTGNGNDTIVAAVGTNSIRAGGGSNLIFTAFANDTIYSTGNDIISGIGGTSSSGDTVFQSSGSILIGSFAKSLFFVGSAATATVLSGTGSYTVNGGQGANLIGGGTAGNNVLGGGTGSVGSTIFGAGNGDLLLARGSGQNELIAGAGNETLSAGTATGNNIFFTALGTPSLTANTSITGGVGNDVYFAGSGHSTIDTGLGGNDLVAIVNGRAGGSILLNNFNTANMKISLQGYGSNEASNDVNGQQTVNGSAVVQLSDNTTITFAGIAHVNLSTFS